MSLSVAKRKVISIGIVICLLLTVFAGCTTNQSTTKSTSSGTTTSAGTTTSTPVKLTFWTPLGDKASQVVKNNGEIAAMIAISEKTGIEIEFQHPAIGQEGEQFNLMIASRKLPDMVFHNSASIIENKDMFLPLSDKLEQNAPNYYSIIQDNTIMKALVASDGEIYTLSHLRLDPSVRVWMGPLIRGDWLEAIDKPLPETIDDWYEVLTLFKTNDMNGNGDPNDEIPFISRPSGGYSFFNFSNAWGLVIDTFYQINNVVHYSPYESQYQNFITEMRKWYDEGLLDNDFAATDGDSFKAKATGSIGGSFYGSLVGVMGAYNQLLKDVNPNYHLVGAPYTKDKNDGIAYNPWADHAYIVQPSGTAINKSSENWQACLKYLDYGFSDEGHMIMNFGIEGVSYMMKDGYPTFTEELTKNPDGLTFAEALAKYAMTANCAASFAQDPRQFAQYSMGTEEQRAANAQWTQADLAKVMPQLKLTVAEQTEFNEIMTDLKTYVSEMSTKFVMGLIPLSDFQGYYDNLKKMGIERAIEIQQEALDRYNSIG